MNRYRYLTIGATAAIARVTISQLGSVFPQTMSAPATVFSWLILALIALAALWGAVLIWRDADRGISSTDFMGIAGLVAIAIALNLVLQGVGVWLAG